MENEPKQTFERFCSAVEDLLYGQKGDVSNYLRAIEKKHGREIAERVKGSVIACAKTPGWLDSVKKHRIKRD
jgi:hypothetical protein